MPAPLRLWPLALLLLAAAAPPPAATHEAAGIAAVRAGDLEAAETHFRAHADAAPDSFVPWYNLAAVASLRNDPERAERHLAKALALGFTDLHTLRRDPHLAALRATDFYRDLVDGWPDLLAARRNADLATARRLLPAVHESRTLDRWKIELVSAHDPVATDQAAAELARLADWITAAVFTDLRADDAFAVDPWATVVLPDRPGFTRWAVAVFGPDARGSGISAIGGAYDHDRRRLVAQDLGATLRHELIHVLHWRDMARRGQTHAAWIQEGLAALVEDYDLENDTVAPAPSWRTNIVKRLRNARRLTPLAELAATDMARLTTRRPLAQYAQSRAVMLFLLDRGRLAAFYDDYTANFDEDPTGLAALRRTLGLEDQNALEAAYQAWIDSLPMVPETGSELPASLGVEVENGDGTGVRVTHLPPGARQRTGLAVGSIITGVNNRPTRDLHEFIRILADYAPGDTITLSHHRGRLHRTTEVTLLPR